MEESEYPRLPPPLKYLNSKLLSTLPRYVRELINSMWFAMSSREPLRYERVALAYHGFFIVDFFSPDDGFRVRQVEREGSRQQMVAKRMPTSFRNEAAILRMLSSTRMNDARNHTAIPSHFIWGRKMHITPLYHQVLMLFFAPKGALNLSQQLVEGVAFLHENRIAHLDISPRNFLLACHPDLPKPRLLIMDMEFATHFPAGVKPTVTLWDRFLAPPEGKMDIDAFAFDMLCVGRSMTYFVKTCTFSAVEKNIKWPEKFSGLHKRLLNDFPDRRPSAKEADDVMREVCKDDAAQLSGNTSQPDFDFGSSISWLSCLAGPTPLPVPQDFATDTVDW